MFFYCCRVCFYTSYRGFFSLEGCSIVLVWASIFRIGFFSLVCFSISLVYASILRVGDVFSLERFSICLVSASNFSLVDYLY